MSFPPVSFPFEQSLSNVFGLLRRPVAQVELYSHTFGQWLVYTMVVDTGADYCVLPAVAALDLGIPLKDCERQKASGVGGQETIFLHRKARFRIGPLEFIAPIGFLKREDVPPLFGRYHALDRFDLHLRNFVTTFSFAS